MALGRRRRERQGELWVATDRVAAAPRNVFYERLNAILAEAGFDAFVEELCAPFYEDGGRPGIPPGTYFRMLLIGYLEGLDSQRGIAWRCGDSLSLKAFLGVGPFEATPDHSSLTRIRDRLSREVFDEVFAFVLGLAAVRGLLAAKSVGVDSTTLEANAAMKSIVRRDTGEDYQRFVRRMMVDEGEAEHEDEPTDEEVRRFDRGRKGKTLSNKEWESETDPDARIVKMKDGRTRLGYKAEHVIDLESEFVLAATVYHGDAGDTATLEASLARAESNLPWVDPTADVEEDDEATTVEVERSIVEVTADKGYHKTETLARLRARGVRTIVPEPDRGRRRWTDKPPEWRSAVVANRRRVKGRRGRRLQRWRSERVERSFAHVCDTGGARRNWLRCLEKANKRYAMAAAAHNLGLLMRSLFGSGKPREFAALRAAASAVFTAFVALHAVFRALRSVLERPLTGIRRPISPSPTRRHQIPITVATV